MQSSLVEETQNTSRQHEVTPRSDIGLDMWAADAIVKGWVGRRWARLMGGCDDIVDEDPVVVGGGAEEGWVCDCNRTRTTSRGVTMF